MTTASTRRLGMLAALALLAGPASAQFASAPVPAGLTDVGYMAAPALLDVDEDGDLDLFVGRSLGDVVYFENIGTASAALFVERTGASNPLDGVVVAAASTLAVADVFGNGHRDLVMGSIDGPHQEIINNGPGAVPQFQAFLDSVFPGSNTAMSFVDFDGDGDSDILAGLSSGAVYVLENTGTRASPGFGSATVPPPFSSFDVGFSAAPAFVDIDGDGDLDILVGNVDGILQVALNEGGPAGPVSYGALADASPLAGCRSNPSGLRPRLSTDLSVAKCSP